MRSGPQQAEEDSRGRQNRARHPHYRKNLGGPRNKPVASDRPLLRLQRNVPEQLMAESKSNLQRFLPAEDISDSEEEDMQESDSDKGGTVQVLIRGSAGALDLHDEQKGQANGVGEDLEPPAKRQALESSVNDLSNHTSVPKWSNPDPYTVLPPADDSQRKKRDVLKLIRKARITNDAENQVRSEVAANNDFISFGFEDDATSVNKEVDFQSSPHDTHRIDNGNSFASVPTGPKNQSGLPPFSENMPPGTQSLPMSADILGPPPGLSTLSGLQDGSGGDGNDYLPLHEDDRNEDLGDRKRTHDDQIKIEAKRPPRKKTKKDSQPDGAVLPEWVAESSTHPTPWLSTAREPTESAGFR